MIFRTLLLALGLLWSCFAGAELPEFFVRQDSGLLLDSGPCASGPVGNGERWILSLNGVWQVSDSGRNWIPIQIPCCYSGEQVLRFERSFTLPQDLPADRTGTLCFLGVNYRCKVVIDGKLLGTHEGGYTSFSFPLPLLVPGSEHKLRLEIDNRLDSHATIPHQSQPRFIRNYGGPFRDIYVMFLPPTALTDVTLRASLLPDTSSGILAAEGMVVGPDAGKAEVLMRVWLSETENPTSPLIEAEPASVQGGAFRTSAVLPAPHLWHPNDPYRYRVEIFLKVSGEVRDLWTRSLGVKKVTLEEGDIFLDDERFFMWGAAWSEDHAREGSALSASVMQGDVRLLKELGANAVMILHHPPHPYWLELCEKEGLLILEEIPVSNIPASHMTDERFMRQARNSLREMVIRDRNSVSVLAWGLGSGLDSVVPETRRYVYDIQETLRQTDDRPMYIVSRMLAKESCSDLVDLLGISVETWDSNSLCQTIEKEASSLSARPAFVADLRPDGIATVLPCLRRLKEVDGCFIGSLNRWPYERPPFPPPPHGDPLLSPGLVDRSRTPLPLYTQAQAIFHYGDGEPAPSSQELASETTTTTSEDPSLFLSLLRILCVLAFSCLFIGPALKIHAFEVGSGRALGNALAAAALSAGGLVFKKAITSGSSTETIIADAILQQVLPSASWLSFFRHLVDTDVFLFGLLFALCFLFWGLFSSFPLMLSLRKRRPGDRIGLPPAGLGLLVQPLLCCFLGRKAFEYRFESWHLIAYGLSGVLSFWFYVRNCSVRWRLKKSKIILTAPILAAVMLLLLLWFLQSQRAFLDYVPFFLHALSSQPH